MVNKVILIGNLGNDPEVRHLESGASVAKFSIATNERYKDKAGETQTITEWHDIIAWRGLAQIAEKYLTKGKMVYVEGKLTTRKWTDQNNQPRRTTEVIANTFQILDRREGNNSGSGNNFPNSMNEPVGTKPLAAGNMMPPSPPQSNTPDTPQAADTPSPSQMPEDDLPF